MKNSKEMANDVLVRIREYREEKRKRKAFFIKAASFVPLTAAAVLAVGLYAVHSAVPKPERFPEITAAQIDMTETAYPSSFDVSSDAAAVSTATDVCAAQTVTGEITSIMTQPQTTEISSAQITAQTTAAQVESSAAAATTTITDASSDIPDTPNAVYQRKSVSYEEAKRLFAHQIKQCTDADFTGMTVGFMSKSGLEYSESYICLDVTYCFTGGTVTVHDLSRSVGKPTVIPNEVYEYKGRTFMCDRSGGNVMVGLSADSLSGFFYIAAFDADADIYAIMDRIISLEI